MAERIMMAPSILSADFTRLGAAVSEVQEGGADFIHVDVMDGHYVPNMTIGPPVVKALKRVATVPLDVHLMIDNADATVQWYLDAGADMITVHVEACDHVHRVIQSIHAAGAKAGVSVNPGTPVEAVRDVLRVVDLVLVMSVNPGFGGQSFIPESVGRIERLVSLCAEENAAPLIEVDGGIDTETAPLVTSAGARVLVAGSAIYCEHDAVGAMQAIRQAGERGLPGGTSPVD